LRSGRRSFWRSSSTDKSRPSLGSTLRANGVAWDGTARKVAVPGAGQAKIINPWVAFLLALVTLGIYYIFWFGIRNFELND
jgi:hypothetical protein